MVGSTSQPRRRTPSSPARRRSRRAPRSSTSCARPATSTASRSPTQRMANFYENGDKPLEIVTSRQWYIRNGGRDEDLRATFLERGRELQWVPREHAPALRQLGRRTQRRLADQPAAVLRRRRSRSGTRSTPRASPTTTQPTAAGEDAAAGRPCVAGARRATPRTSATCPAASPRDPDVMDTWATSSLSPLIVSGWERDPDLFARTFPMDMRPQAHEIIRTWLFSTVVRSHYELGQLPWRTAAISGIVADPQAAEDVEVQGQRRRPARHPGALRPRRRALAGGGCATGHRQPVRRGADEDRPPAGHQDPQRQQVRAHARRRPRIRPRSPSRWTRHCWPRSPVSCGRRPPSWRRSTTPPPWRPPRRSSGPSATTTSSWSRTGRTAAGARRPPRPRRPR